MATVDKKIADEIVEGNGYYSNDPRVHMIIEYDNAWGGQGYGLVYDIRQSIHYAPSEYVHNPRVYWQADPT